MRAFSCTHSLPVTWQRCGHTIWSAISEKNQCYTQTSWLYVYRRRLIDKWSLWEWGFLTFLSPLTLTLTWWPSYMNLTHIPWRYTGCANMNFLHEGFWKLSSDIRTYIQTQTGSKLYTTPLHGWSTKWSVMLCRITCCLKLSLRILIYYFCW